MQCLDREAPPVVIKGTNQARGTTHSDAIRDLTLTPEELYTTYMDAAYEAPDKETYIRMMQKAQECLRKRQDNSSDRADDPRAA